MVSRLEALSIGLPCIKGDVHMKEQSIFIQFDNVKFVFYLFDDEVDDAMRKKLSKLGVPDIQFKWPENQSKQYKALPTGLFKQGKFECN